MKVPCSQLYVVRCLYFCQQRLKPAPEVFVTPIHRFPQERKNAASVWTEDASSSGFKIFLREVTNFSGVHKHIRVVSIYTWFLCSSHTKVTVKREM